MRNATTNGLIALERKFHCDIAENATGISAIEKVAHEIGHWLALGRTRAPRVTCYEADPDLGFSIEAALNRISEQKRNLNEKEAAAISLGAMSRMGLLLPRGIWGRVWMSLESDRPRTVRDLRVEIKRMQRTLRIRQLTNRFLKLVEENSHA